MVEALAVVMSCPGGCPPLPEWLRPWVIAATVAFFALSVLWAAWTRRRRR